MVRRQCRAQASTWLTWQVRREQHGYVHCYTTTYYVYYITRLLLSQGSCCCLPLLPTPVGSGLTSPPCLAFMAGSERQSRTGADGTRLKESGAINKSLTLLNNVSEACAWGYVACFQGNVDGPVSFYPALSSSQCAPCYRTGHHAARRGQQAHSIPGLHADLAAEGELGG